MISCLIIIILIIIIIIIIITIIIIIIIIIIILITWVTMDIILKKDIVQNATKNRFYDPSIVSNAINA
jgi:hypothetical protein